jgi:hypothetical protein
MSCCYRDSFHQNYVWVRKSDDRDWERLGTLLFCLAGNGLRQIYSVLTDLFCTLQGTPWDRLILYVTRDALIQTYSVRYKGRLETDLFCVLQGTPWDRVILYVARDALRQTYPVRFKGRLETDLFCVLQGTPWDRLILCLAGIWQLPAKVNSADLITALRRHWGEWRYVPTY